VNVHLIEKYNRKRAGGPQETEMHCSLGSTDSAFNIKNTAYSVDVLTFMMDIYENRITNLFQLDQWTLQK
jgi:hypothetical protein